MDNVTIILHKPQLGSNIGMTARAMLNCGLTQLRLVAPKEPWPNKNAVAAAVEADAVMDHVRLFDTLEEAISDLTHVYAVTARTRFMQKPSLAFDDLPSILQDCPGKAGLVFGCESVGLTNAAIVLCDSLIHIPVNPGFPSLNLAQAVFAVAHHLWRFQKKEGIVPFPLEPQAPKKDIIELFDHLERELDVCGFLFPVHKRPKMVQNLRNLFQKANLTVQEVRTLRGVIRALREGK